MVLDPDARATFGRDEECDLCLDPDDFTISRLAGELTWHDGVWHVANRSRKRTIHVRAADNVTVPLPPTLPPVMSVEWPLTGGSAAVLILGGGGAHLIELAVPPAAGPRPAPSPAVTLRLTRLQRRVGAALAAGYLRPWPAYAPEPRSFAEVAASVRLSESRVIDEVDRLRADLLAAGLLPGQGPGDPRRLVSEWLTFLRAVRPTDLGGATGVAAQPTRTTVVPPDLDAGSPRTDAPTTTHPLHDALTRVAEMTARAVAPALRARLRTHHGPRWRQILHRQRPQPWPPSLRDYRVCLAVLAHDPATSGWVTDRCRRHAALLNKLANRAAHRATVTSTDLMRAERLGAEIRECVAGR